LGHDSVNGLVEIEEVTVVDQVRDPKQNGQDHHEEKPEEKVVPLERMGRVPPHKMFHSGLRNHGRIFGKYTITAG